MTITWSIRSLPPFRKWLLAIGAAFIVYTLFGFFVLPWILKPVIRNAVADALHRKTTIREIRTNPFSLSAAIRGLEIFEPDSSEKWISAQEIFVNLQLASVYHLGPVLKEVRITKPYVKIIRRKNGTYNFTDILEGMSKKKPETESKPLKYSFNNIQLVGGRIVFIDGPKDARHVVDGIQLAIPFLSNMKYAVDRYVTPFFSAIVNGDAVSLTGRTKPFEDSRETAFEINIINFEIPRYLEYLPFRRDFDVPSAFLDVKTLLSFRENQEGPPSVRADGYLQLRKVRVTGKDGSPIVSLPLVRAVVSPADLGAGDYRLASLTIQDPEIHVVIDKNKRLNLLSLVPEKSRESSPGTSGDQTPSEKEGGNGGSVFSVNEVRLTGGKVRFADVSGKIPFRTDLGDIRIDVDGLSTEKGKTADASLALSTEAGESLGLQGTFSLSPLSSKGILTLGKLVLGKYSPYYRDSVLFDVMRGAADLRTGYEYAKASGGIGLRLKGLEISVKGLRLRQREEKEDFLDIHALSLKDTMLDIDRREIVAGAISTEKGRISVRRDPDGRMNVSRLVPAPVSAAGSSKTPADASGKKATEEAWTVTLKKVSIDGYSARFDDASTGPPASLRFEDIRLHAEDVSTARNRKGKFAFSSTYDGKGDLSLAGSVSVEPAGIFGKLRANNLPIGPLQPYIPENVKVLVTGGSVSAEGNVRIDAPKGAPLRAVYSGEASVNGFSSVDKAQGEDFLKFQTLHVGGMDVGYQPTRVEIRDIALADFYSRIIIHPDGKLNLQGIFGDETGTDNAAGKSPRTASVAGAAQDGAAGGDAGGPPVPVRIDIVTLQGGKVNFSDHFVKPNYSASLVEIGGRVSGLSSEKDRLAEVDLRGKLENSAPLEISGKINPLAKDLFLDLKVDFKDMDLSPLSPYSGKYAGYEIEKGKLTLNLSYRIEGKKLDAQNKVFLDQFTFGGHVDSPEATKLPVRLAVALLKDRSGEIRLDLPVSGRIDDPKFSVWKVVWKIIRNLLVKAATAPFALIGAMFGGGEELSYLEFEPGHSDIPSAGAGKLLNLEKALADRPALKLEIEGHVDMERDPDALRQLLFRRKIAAQKVKALVQAGQPAPALDNVRVEPSEYPEFLARAYKEEKFPKPRNFLGMVKDLPVPEMEKLMLTHIRVTESDLRQLALDRATRVRDALVASGKVDAGRIFLVEPKTLAPAKKENVRDSRVDFRIK